MNRPMVCKRGLNDIWINGHDGKVKMCSWTNYYIGKLTENTIEEIWNGELAQIFRQSMLDGSYRFCNRSKCPHCANDQLEDMMVVYDVPSLPKNVSLSYQLQCNYACKFCRKEHYVPCVEEREQYRVIEREVKKMLPSLDMLLSNGAGEFFCSDSIIRFINEEEIKPSTRILIETNGSLFTPQNWEKIKSLGLHDLSVSVTVHSFVEDTYQYLSGTNLSIRQIMDNLCFVSELRNRGLINNFEIATVICERNFREIPDFVKTCLEQYSMDTIRLRFFEPYGVMDPLTEWFYDVRNEFHPYHDEFVSVMSNPILQNTKVWKWQGETKSLQQESPYILEKRTCDAMAKLMVWDNVGDQIKKCMDGYKRIALYGAARVGVAVLKIFNLYGLHIDTIFDTYADEMCHEIYQIKRPTDTNIFDFDIIIITTDTFSSQIKDTLSRLNYSGVVKTIAELVKEMECDSDEAVC